MSRGKRFAETPPTPPPPGPLAQASGTTLSCAGFNTRGAGATSDAAWAESTTRGNLTPVSTPITLRPGDSRVPREGGLQVFEPFLVFQNLMI